MHICDEFMKILHRNRHKPNTSALSQEWNPETGSKQETTTETVVAPAYQSLHLFCNDGPHWNIHVSTGNKDSFCCIYLLFIPLFRLACCVARLRMWKNPSRTWLESMNNSWRNFRRRWVAKRSLVSSSQLMIDQLLCVIVFVSMLWF